MEDGRIGGWEDGRMVFGRDCFLSFEARSFCFINVNGSMYEI